MARQCFWITEGLYNPEKGYMPALVTEGEAGYAPLAGRGAESEPWWWGRTLEEARTHCARENARRGLSEADVKQIVDSSITAQIRSDAHTEGVSSSLARKLGRR